MLSVVLAQQSSKKAQKKGARPRRIGFAFHNSLPGNSKRIPELTLVIAAWNGESDKLLSPDAVRRIAGISPLRFCNQCVQFDEKK